MIDEYGRPQPPRAGDEIDTLLGFLDFQRATLEWKCAGLDAAGLAASIAPTSMTLGGLLKHMALVEDGWFSRVLHGNPRNPPWDGIDWTANPDWEWESAAGDSPDALRDLWQESVMRSRRLVAQALADPTPGTQGLGTMARRTDFEPVSLRWIVCHMIEEYARHNGHADLLREAVDGQTGE